MGITQLEMSPLTSLLANVQKAARASVQFTSSRFRSRFS
jgi:hypothetical protein